MTGKIIKGIAGFYYVYGEDHQIYECKAKGIFRNRSIKPFVGDQVEIAVLGTEPPEGNIELILPRKNTLIRPAAANVDQVLVVFALADPEPNLNLLDRFLVMVERLGIPAAVGFNKMDLSDETIMNRYRLIYEPAGYPILFFSTHEDRGIDAVRHFLKGKTTALAGPSGVGKSSLMNQILPKAQMETRSISEKIKRGRHTTRHSELFCTEPGTYLMDTPGFSSVFVEDMEAQELKEYFPEFHPCEDECRFPGCVHIGETICGVKAAVQEGKISNSRYGNYQLFYQELKNRRRY